MPKPRRQTHRNRSQYDENESSKCPMDTSENPAPEPKRDRPSSSLETQMKRIKLNRPNSSINCESSEQEMMRKRGIEQDQNHRTNGKRQKITWP